MQNIDAYVRFDPVTWLVPQLTELVAAYCRALLSGPEPYGRDWWEKEMRGVHGFPPDAAAWNREGLLWYANGNDRIAILYRMEDAPESLNQVVRRLSNDRSATCLRRNTAETKPYADLYKAVLGTVRFPADTVDSVLNWDYVRLLYSAEERERMRHRWAE
jgi:hypothetical protein